MQIRFLGCHHTETVKTRLSSVMVDQDMVIDAGAITSTLTTDEQSGIQAILLTHQHLDHIRDVPTLALGGLDSGNTLPVFATRETLESLSRHLLNDSLYPDFTRIPSSEEPRIRLNPLEPDEEREICGRTVIPVPVVHTAGSVGFQVGSPSGKSFFYTGDTNGEGLASIWERMSPDLVIVEVTFPSSQESQARRTSHLTPGLLGIEIERLKEAGGKIPRLVATHMNTQVEGEIKEELRLLADKLGVSIVPAFEGLVLEV